MQIGSDSWLMKGTHCAHTQYKQLPKPPPMLNDIESYYIQRIQ